MRRGSVRRSASSTSTARIRAGHALQSDSHADAGDLVPRAERSAGAVAYSTYSVKPSDAAPVNSGQFRASIDPGAVHTQQGLVAGQGRTEPAVGMAHVGKVTGQDIRFTTGTPDPATPTGPL